MLKYDYGTFVAYCLAALTGAGAATCALKVALKRYFGIEICVGAHQRSAHRRDLALIEQEARDAAMAERLQREMEDEERRRIIAQKRKVRRAKMEELLGCVTMIVREEDIDRNSLDPESGLPEPTVRIPSVTATDSSNSNHSDSDPSADDSKNGPSPSSADRREPAYCAVCLAEYETGDAIVWSLNPDCKHVFHDDCILTWLSRGKKRCPCCRKQFAGEPKKEEVENTAAAAAAEGGEDISAELGGGGNASPPGGAADPATPTLFSSLDDSPRRRQDDRFTDEDDEDAEAEHSDEEMAEEEQTDEDYLRSRRRSRTRRADGDAAAAAVAGSAHSRSFTSPLASPARSWGLAGSAHSRGISSSIHSRGLTDSVHSTCFDVERAAICLARSSSCSEEDQFVAACGDAEGAVDEEVQK